MISDGQPALGRVDLDGKYMLGRGVDLDDKPVLDRGVILNMQPALDRCLILEGQPLLDRAVIIDGQDVLDWGGGMGGERARLHHGAFLVDIRLVHVGEGAENVLYDTHAMTSLAFTPMVPDSTWC